jgi:AcrR family transcriptional regulator
MLIPPRILRAELADHRDTVIELSPNDLARQDRLLASARAALARHGMHAITFTTLAASLRMAPHTLRRFFADLDELLHEILRRHLRAITDAIGAIPLTEPNAAAQRRAAYITATRTQYGAPSEAHILLLRDSHQLPHDLRESVDQLRHIIGESLAGSQAGRALALLDNPEFDADDVEYMLAKPAAQPAPAPRLVDSQPPPAPPRPEIRAVAETAPETSAFPDDLAALSGIHRLPNSDPLNPRRTKPDPAVFARLNRESALAQGP